jgi:moderate conductance mechanosensitive channel
MRTLRIDGAAWLRAVLLTLLMTLPGAFPVSAQTAAPTAPATTSPATAAPSVAELQTLLQTLQDDEARAALVQQLQALAAVRRGTEAAPAAPAEPADFFARVTGRLNAAADDVLLGIAMMLDAPYLLDWANAQITDEAARAGWRAVGLACLAVFGTALLAEWLSRRLLARIGRYAPTRGNGRVRLVLPVLALLLETLPILAFGLAALAASAIMLSPYQPGAEAIRVLVWAAIKARLLVAVAKALLVPGPDWPSLIPAGGETRNYLLIWVRRFAFCGFLGFAIVQAAWWLGAPGGILGVVEKGVGLVLAGLAIVFVLQNRAAVARWIAGDGGTGSGSSWARLRRHLGDTWHILATVYIIAVLIVFWLHQEGGSAYVLRATALSLLAVAAARLLAHLIERLSRRGFAVAPDLKERFPQLEHRANRYLHLLIKLATVAIYGITALAVLQAWDVAAFAWFRTEFGRHATGALLSIAVVLAISLAVWEIFAAAIERNLAGLEQAGAPSRNRRRTLLPLLRTTLLCFIIIVAGLTVLSQLGINIAPLLAGAGVIGLAVGFGSQTLVKDVITGLFILIEDQIAVGDIVDLGNGHSGVVEAISIRTIRLRDLSGIVHTVPFSAVTSVKNLTKDFSFVVARVTIAYRENIDEVVEMLRGVCDGLAEDPELRPFILDRFDFLGVDALNEFSLVLLFRVRTLPAKQWVVGRALNRRIKIAFDEHGIAIRDPSPVKITGPALAAFGERPEAGETDADSQPRASAPLRRSA